MKTKEERVKFFDRKKFEIDNEGFIETMETILRESLSIAIVEGKMQCDALHRCYKQFYAEDNKMTPEFKKEFSRHALILKGQSDFCMIDRTYFPAKKLQAAINNSVRDDIDKYMYEVFAFKKQYFECLEAMQDHMVDEQEFDLRVFDEFTGLHFAHLYQAIPIIGVNNITFNQISGSNNTQGERKEERLKNQDRKDTTRPCRVLISETVTFPAEISREGENKNVVGAQDYKKQVFEDDSHCLKLASAMHVYENSIYTLSRESRDKTSTLYATRRAANLVDDFPFETQLFSCSIF